MKQAELLNEIAKYKKAIQLIDAKIGDEYGNQIWESLMQAFDDPNAGPRRARGIKTIKEGGRSWARATEDKVDEILDYDYETIFDSVK